MSPIVEKMLCRGHSNRRVRCFRELIPGFWGGMISSHPGCGSDEEPVPIPDQTRGVLVVCVENLDEVAKFKPDWVISYSGQRSDKRFNVVQDLKGCPENLRRKYREVVIHAGALREGAVSGVVNAVVAMIHHTDSNSLSVREYHPPQQWVRRRHQYGHVIA